MEQKHIRVLHMIGSLGIGGAQTLMLSIQRKLNPEKVHIDYIFDRPDGHYFKTETDKLGSRYFYMPTFVGTNLLEVIKAWTRFFKTHKEYKIIHAHVYTYASIYLWIAKKFGLKTIIHSHNTSNGPGLKARCKDFLQLPLRYQSDYLYACSLDAGKWLFGDDVESKPNFHLLKNGIDVESFRYSDEKRRAIREKYCIANDDIVFGHVGRFTIPKNHKYLLDVFAEILRHKPNSKLLMLGNGDLYEETIAKGKAMGISDKLIFAGGQSNVAPFYSAMDAFLFPSLFEGLPVSTLEAQANGLACVCSDLISSETVKSSLCCQIPLETSLWVQKSLEAIEKRRTTPDESVYAYDITKAARELEDFYFSILNN